MRSPSCSRASARRAVSSIARGTPRALDSRSVHGGVRSVGLPLRQQRSGLEETTRRRARERTSELGCSGWFAEVDAEPGFQNVGSLGQRGPGSSREDRSGPFEDAEALDQLAPGTKQTRPLDEAKQFERRSNPLTAPNRFLDQSLCLVQFARLEAERAERQDGVKEANVVFDPSCMCGLDRSARCDSRQS